MHRDRFRQKQAQEGLGSTLQVDVPERCRFSEPNIRGAFETSLSQGPALSMASEALSLASSACLLHAVQTDRVLRPRLTKYRQSSGRRTIEKTHSTGHRKKAMLFSFVFCVHCRRGHC